MTIKEVKMEHLELSRSGNLWAVFVGIDEYDDPIWGPLPYCENDARELAKLLTNPTRGGYRKTNVQILAQSLKDRKLKPTRANIMAAVIRLAEVAEADDTILFGFFGHGWEENGVSYIIPSDGWMSLLQKPLLN